MLAFFLLFTAVLFLGLPAMFPEQLPGKAATAPPAPTSISPLQIPAAAANRPNPVHPTAESQARAKRIYGIDCVMCHGEDGSGKGDVPTTAKMLDYRDPGSLKSLTDGQIFFIIENGEGEMPPEGARAKPDEIWSLVLYLRSLGKKNTRREGAS